MRNSKVLKIMREGGVAISTKCNLDDPRSAIIGAACGFDCVWIDLEHTPLDIGKVEEFARAVALFDVDLLTRVRKGSYSDMVNPLEADSTGIMIPHLMSLKEAKDIVYYTKFHPIGRRPIDGGNADNLFCIGDMNEYIVKANQERFNVVQIEDPEPLDELEEICALEGIDMIFFGPADFSQGIGDTLNFANPKLIETRELVAKTARKYGKFAGTVGSTENFSDLIKLGYNFINITSDVVILKDIQLKTVENLKNQLKNLNK